MLGHKHQTIYDHLQDHSVVLALASLNIPTIYQWITGNGIHYFFAGLTAISLDYAMYRASTDNNQTGYSKALVLVSAVGLAIIQVYLYGAYEGLMHSIPIAIAYLFLKHVQSKKLVEQFSTEQASTEQASTEQEQEQFIPALVPILARTEQNRTEQNRVRTVRTLRNRTRARAVC